MATDVAARGLDVPDVSSVVRILLESNLLHLSFIRPSLPFSLSMTPLLISLYLALTHTHSLSL